MNVVILVQSKIMLIISFQAKFLSIIILKIHLYVNFFSFRLKMVIGSPNIYNP